MAQNQYPIICNNEHDIKAVQSRIYDYLAKQIQVHFLLRTQRNTRCCTKCTEAINGQNPNIKIVLIDPSLEDEVNALVTVFYCYCTSLRYAEETKVGDRNCAFCGTL